MNVLDWCLVALVGIYALSGYWQGFITGACATAGLLLGGLVGIWAAPLALGDAAPSLWVSLGALFIVIVSASLGQAVLQYVGAKIRDRITWQPIRAVDAIGGSVLSAVAVLLVAWALGVAVSGTRIGAITPLVRDSTILAEVNRTLPSDSSKVLQTFNNVVGTTFFPRYLEPFAPERIVAVKPGDPRMLTDPDVLAAESSVVKVRGANGCGSGVEGTGFFYAPGRLMTNAHVVAGVTRPEVEVAGSSVVASVVLYDADLDVAVLSLPDAGVPPLAFDTEVRPRDPVAVLGYPEDGPYDVQSGRVRSEQRLRSPDIYGEGTVIRQVFSLRALIRPGNSGGPIITSAGDVAGVVFAASVSDPDTGYALTADQVAEAAASGLSRQAPVDTGTCVR
ncbi:MarP family serine protease [Nocardioides sp. zg-1308]|uniref:MarP family serine protease n=1 Tax=Nocardioides renjunii TaxID=3095075 RepID=A0ABU5KH01_9ACTN|nr:MULTISPECIES: MarP family serine protease [unclassified Nocardioides]MDZ5664118.1 MarP family serine protease [Nocardioides sp. S-58]NPD04769.1 MarP family serine protease [Nocardioides sp. zg-1308]